MGSFDAIKTPPQTFHKNSHQVYKSYKAVENRGSNAIQDTCKMLESVGAGVSDATEHESMISNVGVAVLSLSGTSKDARQDLSQFRSISSSPNRVYDGIKSSPIFFNGKYQPQIH
ncbi:hypothetical protein ABEB36_000903 [Hypothenemus hampei]|uniref:Uncharacterized protein n=1 Tax=Hypothenemus hampei TaxID=57062 RepID=A0ABD1FCT9_HYPHA